MTWLQFQLSTDNQNGRHLATNFFKTFFFRISAKPGIYIYRFSGSASLLVLSVFMWDWKRGRGGQFGFINFNKSFFFQLIALKSGIYRVTASAQGYWSACTVFFINRLHFVWILRQAAALTFWLLPLCRMCRLSLQQLTKLNPSTTIFFLRIRFVNIRQAIDTLYSNLKKKCNNR